MSLAALSGLAEGFSRGVLMAQRRKERAEDAARLDRYIAAIGAMPMPGQIAHPTGHGGRGTNGALPPGGGTPPATSGDPLLSLIDRTEGGGRYDTLFGHAQRPGGPFAGVDVSNMTIDEVLTFQDPSGPYGQYVKRTNPEGVLATPAGRYQIVGTTLRGAVAEMGLPGWTRFDAATQDAIASHLARKRLASRDTAAGKRAALRAEWAGFRTVSDADLDAAIAAFEAKGGRFGAPRPRGAMTVQ